MTKLLNLWTEARENVLFLLCCAGIIAALAIAARIAEHFLPAKRKISPARRMCTVSICAAIAAILHIFLRFPLPFLAPGFYEMDFSELPVMLCGFYLGPSAAVACEAVKILLKLLIEGPSSAFIGDFANFVVGCSLVIPASILYHTKKSRTSALWGLAAGTLTITVFASLFNAVYLLPKFAAFYGWPLETLIAMGTEVNPYINSVSSFVLLAVAPMNLIKGIAVSVLTLLLYKRVARPLFGK